MQLVLDMTGRKRPIVSLPFALGILQGAILERLPVNLFTVTQAQVRLLMNILIHACASI
jgi:NADH dehydrogenase